MTIALQILGWYVLSLGIAWIAFPLCFRFLGSLVDKGYALARAAGLLLWGFSFWWLTTLRITSNSVGGILLSGFTVLVISVVALRKFGGKNLSSWLGENWRLMLFEEALFLVVFVFSALLRAGNPNIDGTEKPMELAFINAISQSQFFPPHDPWLSGYAISYYYFGYVMVAMLAKVTGTATSVAFNLAISLWYAMGALGAFGIVHTLLTRLGAAARKVRWLALLAPLLIFLLGNAEGFLEVLHAGGVFWQSDPAGGLQSNFWTQLDILELREPPSAPLDFLPKRDGGLVWWRASRVLSDYDNNGQWHEVIDEFPYFSLLLGDLHPHVLSIPFFLLAIGLAAGFYFKEPASISVQNSVQRLIRSADFWAASLVIGGMAFLNIWDFPTSAGLIAGGLALREYQRSGKVFPALLGFIKMGLFFGLAGIALYLPYFLGFSSQAGGLLPSMSFFTRGVHFWVMFATLLLPILGYLVWRVNAEKRSAALATGLGQAALAVIGLLLLAYLASILIVTLPGLINGLLGADSPLGIKLQDAAGMFLNKQGAADLGSLLSATTVRRMVQPGGWLTILVLGGLAMAVLKRKPVEIDAKAPPLLEEDLPEKVDQPSPDKFAGLLVGIGLLVVGFPEFFYLMDFFGNRMNTIFKFYYQGWLIWGVAAGFGLGALWLARGRKVKTAAAVITILVILLGAAYPLLITSSKVNFDEPARWTLDGQRFFGEYHPDEQAAVEFLLTLPKDILVEAVGGSYSSYARIATFTGYPNVLGWPGHESQWRGGYEEMGSRGSDIERLYRTANWSEASEILQRYNIAYVFVGSLETSTYVANLQKFDQNLVKIFEQNGVIIYQVPLAVRQITGGEQP